MNLRTEFENMTRNNLLRNYEIDLLSGSNGIWRDIILTFFTVNESISIIENLGELGVEFPAGFQNAIKSLSNKNTEDKID